MDLLQLRYFFESAESENFSHTASRHRVPPSTVSASVRRLEDELGCKLFCREDNRIRISSDGKKLYSALTVAFSAMDSAVDELQNRSSELTGELYLLVRSDRAIIYHAVPLFSKLNPQVVFHISHNFESSYASKYDMIIDESGEKFSGYTSLPFISESLKFAASVNNDLGSGPVSLRALAHQKFIALSESSPLGKQLKNTCKAAGFRPDIRIECDDPLYLRHYVAIGMGITLFPEKSWKGEANDNIVFLNVPDFYAKRQNCIYLKEGYLSRVADTFCDFLLKMDR